MTEHHPTHRSNDPLSAALHELAAEASPHLHPLPAPQVRRRAAGRRTRRRMAGAAVAASVVVVLALSAKPFGSGTTITPNPTSAPTIASVPTNTPTSSASTPANPSNTGPRPAPHSSSTIAHTTGSSSGSGAGTPSSIAASSSPASSPSSSASAPNPTTGTLQQRKAAAQAWFTAPSTLTTQLKHQATPWIATTTAPTNTCLNTPANLDAQTQVQALATNNHDLGARQAIVLTSSAAAAGTLYDQLARQVSACNPGSNLTSEFVVAQVPVSVAKVSSWVCQVPGSGPCSPVSHVLGVGLAGENVVAMEIAGTSRDYDQGQALEIINAFIQRVHRQAQ